MPAKFFDLLKGAVRSPLFLVGLVARFVALPLAGSKYLSDLFIPFLDNAVKVAAAGGSGWLTPWTDMPPHFFPYGSFLYFFLFLPKLAGYAIFGDAALGTTALSYALVKVPLFAFDAFALYLLATCTKFQRRNLLIFYWLNPVLFFITYLHGQLDVVSVTMCVAALVFLARGAVLPSAVFMAAATLSKFHVVIVLPLIASFIWNRSFPRTALRQLAAWGAVYLVLTGVGFLPLQGSLGYVTGGSPEALRIFAARFDLGQGHYLYVGVMALLLVIGRLALASEITSRGLTVGAALAFSVLVLITDPMPGWYFWFMPFVALYFATVATPVSILFWAMCGFYFLYFAPLYWFDWQAPDGVAGMALAALQATVAGIVAVMWGEVRRELPLSGRTKPLILGVAGDSGAGKDSFSRLMCGIFGERRTLVVAGDDYHKWERGHQRWNDYTHLSPRANHLTDMARHTTDLLSWQAVAQPHYHHGTGRFTTPRVMAPRRTIVVQGLHSLYYRGLRDMYDLSVFLAPDEELRTWWKVSRDVTERGHDPQRVLESMARRRDDSSRHINPQREVSDWVIEYYSKTRFDLDLAVRGEKPHVAVRHRVWNDAPVDRLVEELRQVQGLKIDVSPADDNFEQVVIDIDGDLPSDQVHVIAGRLFPNLRTLTRSWHPPQWAGGYDGITQLLSLVLVRGHHERERHALG